MANILPLTTMFPSQPSPLRVAQAAKLAPPAAPAATAPATTPAAPATPTPQPTTTTDIQNQSKGFLGLVHTSLTGLNNFLKNLPSRKTLLGE
jgi:hypothetical protein